MTDSISILHSYSENEPFWILNKKASVPSAPLKEGDFSALGELIKICPEAKNVSGRKKIEYGLLHRIDTETCGLLLIAGRQDFYDEIFDAQKNDLFLKSYSAECEKCTFITSFFDGFPPPPEDFISGRENVISSKFRYFGKHNFCVRPVSSQSGLASQKKSSQKIYTTKIFLEKKGESYFARARIAQGFRHQVRCHLAWCGFPVKGDILYNPNAKENDKMKFSASGLYFSWNGKNFSFEL